MSASAVILNSIQQASAAVAAMDLCPLHHPGKAVHQLSAGTAAIEQQFRFKESMPERAITSDNRHSRK
jgi:hypothetical protein